jgi:hypothetical protein
MDLIFCKKVRFLFFSILSGESPNLPFIVNVYLDPEFKFILFALNSIEITHEIIQKFEKNL